jgi:hypothetical protein
MYGPGFDEANHYIERFEFTLEAIEAVFLNIGKLRWASKCDFFILEKSVNLTPQIKKIP